MTKAQKFFTKFFYYRQHSRKKRNKRENVNRESHYYTFSLFSFAFAEWIYSHAITSIFPHTLPPPLISSLFATVKCLFINFVCSIPLFFISFYYVERICWVGWERGKRYVEQLFDNLLLTLRWARYCCWTHSLRQGSLQSSYASTGWQISHFLIPHKFQEFRRLAVAGNLVNSRLI